MRTISWHGLVCGWRGRSFRPVHWPRITAPDREISLTIYNKNIALIEHVRPISAPAGRQRIEFAGVSAQIVPETVSFIAPERRTHRAELRLRPADARQAHGEGRRQHRSAGARESRHRRRNHGNRRGALHRGRRRAAHRRRASKCCAKTTCPTRVIFDKVPENLRAQPTLSVLVNAAKPVNEVARLTYLSRGFNWAADYVAVFDEAKGDTSMQGWITLQQHVGHVLRQRAHATRGRRREPRRLRRAVVDVVATAAQSRNNQRAAGTENDAAASSSATTTSTRSSSSPRSPTTRPSK